jgi:Uma2 family endonuclease
MTTATKKLPADDQVYYPDSDGKPMGETARHVNNLCGALDIIKRLFAGDPNVYVGGNMFLYYVLGDPNRNVCPDLFVVKGVPKIRQPERRSYRTWEENGKGPDAIIEYTSKSTKREDTVTKMELYRDVLKVKEYYLFDPFAECLRPPFQGYRRVRGDYVPIKPVRDRLPSRVLGLHLENGGDVLRFWDPATQQYLLTPEELQIERAREAEARRRAEAEVERLRCELDELRRRS